MFKKYVQIYFLDLFHVPHQTMLSNLIFMTEHCLTHVIFQAQRKSWEFQKNLIRMKVKPDLITFNQPNITYFGD